MDKITLTKSEQIKWAARMAELRYRAIGRFEAMSMSSIYHPLRVALVGKVARDLNRRWRYPRIHWNRT